MHQHIAGYTDEWADVLADPDKLSRFVSFVNAPDAPDPFIRFSEQRGQPVPAEPVLLGRPGVRKKSTEDGSVREQEEVNA